HGARRRISSTLRRSPSELEREGNHDLVIRDSFLDDSRVARWCPPDLGGGDREPRSPPAAAEPYLVAELPRLCLREAERARLSGLWIYFELYEHALPLHENLRCRRPRVVIEVARRRDSHPSSARQRAGSRRRVDALAPASFAGLRAGGGGAEL